jgi:hypothetical protein
MHAQSSRVNTKADRGIHISLTGRLVPIRRQKQVEFERGSRSGCVGHSRRGMLMDRMAL